MYSYADLKIAGLFFCVDCCCCCRFLIIIFKHPVGNLKRLFDKYSYLAAGFYGGIAGAIVTMFVNDSGVVAAATILFYPMLTLLYLLRSS
jgi:hypothetical protein